MYSKIVYILNKITNLNISIASDVLVLRLILCAKFFVRDENISSETLPINPFIVDRDDDDLKKLAAIDFFDFLLLLDFIDEDVLREIKMLNYSSFDYTEVGILLSRIMSPINAKNIISKGQLKDSFFDYCKDMHSNQLKPISFLHYKKIFEAVRFKKVDAFETDLFCGNAYRTPEAINFIPKKQGFIEVINRLGLNYEKRLEFAADCFYGKGIRDLIESYPKNRFSQSTLEDEQNILSAAKEYVLSTNPLKIAEELYTSKVTEYYSNDYGRAESKQTVKTKKENNVGIENSIFLNLVNVALSRFKPESFIFVNPSPFFIEKWAKNTEVNTLFLIDNLDLCYMLEVHFEDPKYSGHSYKNLKFATYDEFKIQEIEWDNTHVGAIISGEKELNLVDGLLRTKVKSVSAFGEDEIIKRLIRSAGAYAINLYLLPAGLHGTTTQYKSLILLQKSDQYYDIFAKNMRLSHEREGLQYILADDQHVNLKPEDLLFEKSLRAIINGSKKERQRNNAKTIMYSPEIAIVYSAAPIDKSGYVRGKAYIRERFSFNKIKESEASFRCMPEKVEKWILEKYLKKTIKKKDSGEIVSIKELIKKEVLQVYSNKPISFRTLYFIVDDIDEYFNKRSLTMLKKVLQGEIGELVFAYTSLPEIAEQISDEYTDAEKSEILESLVVLSSIGAENGFMSEESIKKHIQDLNVYKIGRNNLSRLLSRRSFDAQTAKIVMKKIREEVRQDETLSMGVMLRLLTGIEPEALCALRYRDLTVDCEGNISLVINKLVSLDGREVIPVRRTQQARIIPLPKNVSKLLINKIVNVKKEYQGDMNDLPVFSQKKEIHINISPVDLKEYSKKILEGVGIEDAYMPIVNTKKQTKFINLSELSVDVFRGTISLWGRRKANMFSDEVNFLLGLERKTTAGKHYIDFNSAQAQQRLRSELQIIEDFFREV